MPAVVYDIRGSVYHNKVLYPWEKRLRNEGLFLHHKSIPITAVPSLKAHHSAHHRQPPSHIRCWTQNGSRHILYMANTSGKTRSPRWNMHQVMEMQLGRHQRITKGTWGSGQADRGKIPECCGNMAGSLGLLEHIRGY